MTKKKVLQKFDQYIESRISLILNWLWKSGLLLFVIGLLFQQLNVQKTNSEHIIKNGNTIKELTTDIKYLRRDVDGILFTDKIKGVNPNG